MRYSELSNIEINNLVMAAQKVDPYRVLPLPDYCNNPADMWPIITGCKIALYPPFDRECNKWEAHTVAMDGTSNGDSAFSKNPLRAAAIVYLMMQEQQHDR